MGDRPQPIRLPSRVRRAAVIPPGPTYLAGTWGMGDGRIGLWIATSPKSTGRRYPVTSVSIEDAHAWLNDAKQEGDQP